MSLNKQINKQKFVTTSKILWKFEQTRYNYAPRNSDEHQTGGGGEWWWTKSVAKILAIVVSASRMHDEMPLFKVSGTAPNKSIKLIFAVTLVHPLNSLLSLPYSPFHSIVTPQKTEAP